MSNLIVSRSPHLHGGDCIKRNTYGVVFALLSALLVSFYNNGINALVVCLSSVVACMLFEWAIAKYMFRRDFTLGDGSAVITGLLLGMNLPCNLPLWMVAVGSLVAIGIGKMAFGGLGCNPFNPALVGKCALLVGFPVQMMSWRVAAQPMDNMCATSALALILGLGFMLWKRIITWHIPVSIILSAFVFAAILHVANPMYADPLTMLLSGGMLLGAIFMATDYVTSPMTRRGKIVYGVAIGMLAVAINTWRTNGEGVLFAILIMNAFTPLINKYCKPKRYGQEGNSLPVVAICVVLGGATIAILRAFSLVEGVNNVLTIVIGLLLAAVAFVGLRGQLALNSNPRQMRGAGIMIVTIGLLVLVLLGLCGVDNGLTTLFTI